MREIYDVLVVGAGPSGSSAAQSAALEGAKTLLVEKKKEIGVPVRCGEFIPSLNEIRRLLPRAVSIESFYKLLTEDTVSNKTTRIRVYSPKNRSYEFDFEGLVLNRNISDKILAIEAEKSGAIVKTSTVVETVSEKESVKKVSLRNLSGKTFVEAKLLIGADGFPSRIGEWTNLAKRCNAENVVICAQQRMMGTKLEEENIVQIYFNKKYAPGGYAWIISKGNGEANVGVGVRLPHLKQGSLIIDYLNSFLKGHPVASTYFQRARSTSLIVKMVPVGGQVRNLYRNGTLLVGDAAGMVIAINGSGVPTAFVSGHIAGEIASRHLKGDCELFTYATVLRKNVGNVLKRGYFYRRLADVLMRSDDVFEKILQMIGTRNVAKVIKCEPFFKG